MTHLRVLQKGKTVISINFKEPLCRTSLALKEKTNLNEILTSKKLVRFFRHPFELKSISLKFKQQCFSVITYQD